ncbi:ORF18 [Streptococcus phage 01205]|uniref:ORF18 n=1 Tax=Streptococcus phage O1205 TaxID=85154 RepID=O34049_BPO12|nr:ORF18 [Streptococcus phage 01205]AAC79534.1 ORF18 [Streptococcus phage 01205]
MRYKVIVYYDHMEDDVETYENKDDAINRLHHLRGVKYRNSRLYTVEMVEA